MTVTATPRITVRRARPRPQPPDEPVWTQTHETLETLDVAPPRPRPLELETISSRWQVALDAAQNALGAVAASLPPQELARRRSQLSEERLETANALTRLARVAGVRPVPWLSPVPVSNEMLGLPTSVTTCLFDLDGVLTDSALLHAWAWGAVLDPFLLQLSERTHWHFIPFDREADYREYIDGRPRLEGVHAFLGSRGIRLPEGSFDDPADAGTAHGLARRKGELLGQALRHRGSTALPGARRYLQAAGHAGLGRCVLSASSNTSRMLELAGLATLVEASVDADLIRAEGLRSRPAPDLLLVACRRLGVRPNETVTFTHSAAGVSAGHAAGLAVIGIGEGAQEELLRGFGAEQVHPSLRVLLDRRLADSR
jgi:HAD superfamily hydrolase (TIGR01509 family)